MLKPIHVYLIILCLLLKTSTIYAAEDKARGAPPAPVVTAAVSAGMVAPESEFIGTVYYHEVSDVASEVFGKVETVNFEEGQAINKGHLLVELGSDLLEKTLQATRANYEQTLSDLEKAILDFQRAKRLYGEKLISEESYDERRFNVTNLEKKAASLKADVERLETELGKKNIKAPFEGVVIKKHVERGEWLNTGSVVATIANDKFIDIITEVPEGVVRYIRTGMETRMLVSGKYLTGRITALIPRGDISTRTFPVKIGTKNTLSLIEGMEARVTLPSGERQSTLTVPTDAVIALFGQNVLFAVQDSKAVRIPVNITGYEGMTVGVHAEGLSEGMKVVIKGNERLRDGQEVVTVQKSGSAEEQ